MRGVKTGKLTLILLILIGSILMINGNLFIPIQHKASFGKNSMNKNSKPIRNGDISKNLTTSFKSPKKNPIKSKKEIYDNNSLSAQTETQIKRNFYYGFKENKGQYNKLGVLYYHNNSRQSLAFMQSKILLISIVNSKEITTEFTFGNANNVLPIPKGTLSYTTTYSMGPKTISNIHNYKEIWYINVYNHIDLRYYWNGSGLKYEFQVHPGGNPADIEINVSDTGIVKASQGNVIIIYKDNTLENAIVLFQDSELKSFQNNQITGEQLPVDSVFYKENESSYGFNIGTYNTQKLLIIDPVARNFTSYVGTNNLQDLVVDVAANDTTIFVLGNIGFGSGIFVFEYDHAGVKLNEFIIPGGTGMDIATSMVLANFNDLEIVGYTDSTDFPLINQDKSSIGGTEDGFIYKIDPRNGVASKSTYFGGNGIDRPEQIIFYNGQNYITGYTTSTDLTTHNPYQSSYGGGAYDGFVMKNDGISYTSYLGGSGDDRAHGISINPEGVILVTGETNSTDFPIQSAQQGTNAGKRDIFITGIKPSLTTLNFSTYFGGANDDIGKSIAIDGSLNVYVLASSASTSISVGSSISWTTGKLGGGMSNSGGFDNLLLWGEFYMSSISFSYSFIGGNGNDFAKKILTNPTTNYYDTGYEELFIVGTTYSTDFPMVNAIDTSNNLAGDGLYYSIRHYGTPPTYAPLNIKLSSYIGGTQYENLTSATLDSNNDFIVVGNSKSTDLATFNADRPISNGDEGFISKFDYDDLPPTISSNLSNYTTVTYTEYPVFNPVTYSQFLKINVAKGGNFSIQNEVSSPISVYIFLYKPGKDPSSTEYYTYRYLNLGTTYTLTNSSFEGNWLVRVWDPAPGGPEGCTLLINTQVRKVSTTESNFLNSFTVHVNDTNLWKYETYLDSNLISTDNFTSNNLDFVANLDVVHFGINSLSIRFYDFEGNYEEINVKIYVADSQKPYLSYLQNMVISEDLPNYNLSWAASDQFPGSYNITKDGSLVYSSNSWVSGSDLNYTISPIMIGTYNYTISVYDQAGNFQTDFVIITITDITNPTITSPGDIYRNEGYGNYTLQWQIFDKNPDNYSIYINSQPIIIGEPWINGTLVNYTISDFSFGVYNVKLSVFDTYGNMHNDTINFVVQDNIPPILSLVGLVDQDLIGSKLPIQVNATDNNLVEVIYKWDTQGNISLTLNNLYIPALDEYGSHTLTIYAKDAGNNEVMVSYNLFIDNKAPQFQINYEDFVFDSTENFSFTILEDSVITTSLYNWGGDNSSLSGNSIILPSEEGNYTLTIYLGDNFGNKITLTYNIAIDNTAPFVNLINHSDEDAIKSGTVLGIFVIDDYTKTISVQWDSEPIVFLNEYPYTTTMPTGETGFHKLQITVQDYAGHEYIKTIFLKTDDTAPQVNAPEINNKVMGTFNYSVTIAEKNEISEVRLYIDDNLLLKINNTTTPGIYEFSIDTTLFEDGSHSLRCEATDSAGNIGDSLTRNFVVDNVNDNFFANIPPIVTIAAASVGVIVVGTVAIRIRRNRKFDKALNKLQTDFEFDESTGEGKID